MGIRKRPTIDPAAIERFGDAADAPMTSAEPAAASPVVAELAEKATAASKPRAGTTGEWPIGVGRTLTVRWTEPSLAEELAEVAALEDRSQHKTALRALQRGLEVIRAEHEAGR